MCQIAYQTGINSKLTFAGSWLLGYEIVADRLVLTLDYPAVSEARLDARFSSAETLWRVGNETFRTLSTETVQDRMIVNAVRVETDNTRRALDAVRNWIDKWEGKQP